MVALLPALPGSSRSWLAERAGVLLGIAPMMILREGGVERALRRLRFVGDGTSETDHMNFIVAAEERVECSRRFLRRSIDCHGTWPISARCRRTLRILCSCWNMPARRGWLLDHMAVPCPRRQLPATYDDLLRSLPGRLRTSIRSARRELEARHRVEFGQVRLKEELLPRARRPLQQPRQPLAGQG